MAAQALTSQRTPATQPPPQADDSRPASGVDRLAVLRQRVLQVNGLVGGTSGPILAAGAGYVAPLFGLQQSAAAVPVLEALGLGLTLFAIALLWMARRPVAPAMILVIGVVDALWVAGSVGLLLSGALPLSVAGAWTVAIQADVVAVLAAVECYAWWRSRPARRA
jgi:hypothetical protein